MWPRVRSHCQRRSWKNDLRACRCGGQQKFDAEKEKTMSSLLGKVMDQSGENDSSANDAAPAPTAGPARAGLLGAIQNAAPAPASADEAHSQLQQATAQLSPSQFQGATTSALDSLAPEVKAALQKVLAGSGAAQATGVTDTSSSSGLSTMLHWVQTNVPGGIPGVLATLGVAGGAAAVAGSGQTDNVVSQVEHAGGGLFHSVLGAIMPAINNAVSSAASKVGQ
jgi:hypothetical protein